jgi:hypothetical protein
MAECSEGISAHRKARWRLYVVAGIPAKAAGVALRIQSGLQFALDLDDEQGMKSRHFLKKQIVGKSFAGAERPMHRIRPR